jgi:hypothetical protein
MNHRFQFPTPRRIRRRRSRLCQAGTLPSDLPNPIANLAADLNQWLGQRGKPRSGRS